jgi:hypothetical protein
MTSVGDRRSALPADVVGGGLLAAVGAMIAGGLLFRDGKLPILLGATVLALAFYLLPTRVHERYLFPVFATGALLAASTWRLVAGYGVVGVLNTVNLHAVLAGSLSIGRFGGRGGAGGGGGGGFGRTPGTIGGGFGGGPSGGVPGAGGRGGFASIQLPFADLARNEVVVAAVAIGQTAALVALLGWWFVLLKRPATDPHPGVAPRYPRTYDAETPRDPRMGPVHVRYGG